MSQPFFVAPSSSNPLTWGDNCAIIDGVREVPLRVLAPGQRFALVLSATTPEPHKRINGTVVRQTACSIVVDLDEGQGRGGFSFTSPDGEVITIGGGGNRRTTWSPDTAVLILPKEGESKMAQERVAALPIGRKSVPAPGKKAVAKTTVQKVAKQPKTLNPCGCGCGDKVAGRFRQGHDSKFYSMLKKVIKGELGFDKLPKLVQNTVGNVAGAKKLVAAHGG
jgi:hypothetical protein